MQVWTPEHPTHFYDRDPVQRLGQITAIAGSAVCDKLVDCSVFLTTENQELASPNNYFKIILQTITPEGETASFVSNGHDERQWCHREIDSDSGLTQEWLLANPDNPDGVRTVTLRGPEEAQEFVSSSPATLDTMVAMAQTMLGTARPYPGERPPWKLVGNVRGADMFLAGAACVIPIVGQLLQKTGGLLSQEPSKGFLTNAMVALDIGSSGRVYTKRPQILKLGTINEDTRRYANFDLTFSHNNVLPEGEFSTVRCTLYQKDRRGIRTVTKDVLQQQGDELVRVRKQRVGTGDLQKVGEYPASDLTILDMANAAIAVQDLPIR